MTARLVLLDDDELLRDVLAGNLMGEGFIVTGFARAEALIDHPDARAADLLILDWQLPGMNGLEFLRALRARGVTNPALFFTSHNDTLYEEAALGQGAVDFIDKTRSFAIILKRIRLILDRLEPAAAPPSGDPIGPLRLDPARHTAFWYDKPVDLTFGEYRVVALLAMSGRDIPYREIYDALRGENFIAGDGPQGYRANVRALIKRIREKFQLVDCDFAAIEAFPGFGYRWVAGQAAR